MAIDCTLCISGMCRSVSRTVVFVCVEVCFKEVITEPFYISEPKQALYKSRPGIGHHKHCRGGVSQRGEKVTVSIRRGSKIQ